MKWVEVWIDSASGSYVLLLRPASEGLEIVDPQEGARVVGVLANYDEATHWLNEEEYDLVEGRWSPES